MIFCDSHTPAHPTKIHIQTRRRSLLPINLFIVLILNQLTVEISSKSTMEPSINTFKHEIYPVIETLCARKCQLALFKYALDKETSVTLDMFTSITPSVGKRFPRYSDLETKRTELLNNFQFDMSDLSTTELNRDIVNCTNKYNVLVSKFRDLLNPTQYMSLQNWVLSKERELIKCHSTRHKNKIQFHHNKFNSSGRVDIVEVPNTERRLKYKDFLVNKRRRKNQNRRKRLSDQRQSFISNLSKEIQDKGLVLNFSSVTVPDAAFIYLSLGDNFILTPPDSSQEFSKFKSNLILDGKEFLRKLAWKVYFQENISSPDSDPADSVKNLKIKNRSWPILSNNKNLFDDVSDKMIDALKSLTPTKSRTNLTPLQQRGLSWCKNNVKNKTIVITKADKGGSILIMDYSFVENTIAENLANEEQYVKLPMSPVNQIRDDMKLLTLKHVDSGGMTQNERHLTTGHTVNGGKSHDPCFRGGSSYPYPLYKVHKLDLASIRAKTLPPYRMVTAMQSFPTSRVEVFLSNVLSPLAEEYCGSEYLRDTPFFLRTLEQNKEILCSPGVVLFSIDVHALYPSIQIKLVLDAIGDAFHTCGNYTESRVNCVLELSKFCLDNSAVQYRGDWYRALKGIITGGSASVPFANIFMRYVTKDFSYSKLLLWLRFIDDVFGVLQGTARVFSSFLEKLNSHLEQFGIYFTVDLESNPPGKVVNFLDVTVDVSSASLSTRLFRKPTDARRYLNFQSFHPKHTFGGVVFSQMRRIALLDSNPSKFVEDIAMMKGDFGNVGYPGDLLNRCEAKASQLNRSEIIQGQSISTKPDNADVLCFVTDYSVHHKSVRSILDSFSGDFTSLLGTQRVVLSARRNPSTRTLLFKQKSFAALPPVPVEDHRCGSCKTCEIISNSTSFELEGSSYNANKFFNCKSENVIYIAICEHCGDYYIGQTQAPLKDRVNGHRSSFSSPSRYKDSALALHINKDHPEHMPMKVNNYLFSVLFKFDSGHPLDKAEDSLLLKTKATTLHLNRYKVKR